MRGGKAKGEGATPHCRSGPRFTKEVQLDLLVRDACRLGVLASEREIPCLLTRSHGLHRCRCNHSATRKCISLWIKCGQFTVYGSRVAPVERTFG